MKTVAARSSALRAAAGIVAATAIVLLVACKGSGSDDSSSVLPCTNISFTRALTTSPASGDVYFAPLSSTCTSNDVAVNIANLAGIYTVGFDFTYPASLVAYQSYSLGPLLKKGSPAIPAFVLVQSPSPGLVQATMSLLAPDPSVSAVGSEVLITFHFTKVASGSGIIDFNSSPSSLVSEQVLDQSGAVLPASFGPGHGGTVLVP